LIESKCGDQAHADRTCLTENPLRETLISLR
jgi:hypothetical protein